MFGSVKHLLGDAMRRRRVSSVIALQGAALVLLALAGCAVHPASIRPSDGLIGTTPAQRDAAYWIARTHAADRVLLDADAIAAQNARMQALDSSLHDLAALPPTLPRATVDAHIRALSAPPARTLLDASGTALSRERLDALADALALDTIPAQVTPAFALVVRRADLRTFPTTQRVFATPGDTRIDRFQESALFPGTPVAILHASRDGAWRFVESDSYRAWIAADALAVGGRDTVLAHAATTPALIVTGATARTVSTSDQPSLSALQLDMGVRVPHLRDWPADTAVNGQHPVGLHVIELPLRNDDGTLAFAPALLARDADVAAQPLPFTRAQLLRQAFKFLGEPYGWGHADGTRDCSGFVAEVHRSFGLLLPRNTGDQARSPALETVPFDPAAPAHERDARLRALAVGDLVYIPGHVMLVIGHDGDRPFVIHDVAGIHVHDTSGAPVRLSLNAVVVTPLDTLLTEDGAPLATRITAIRRIPAATR